MSFGLSPEDELYAKKLDFLRAAGRGDVNGTGLTFPLYSDRFTNEMLEALRLLCLTPEDVSADTALTSLPLNTYISSENEVRQCLPLTQPRLRLRGSWRH